MDNNLGDKTEPLLDEEQRDGVDQSTAQNTATDKYK